MSSDVILENDEVRVDTRILHTSATDIMLDNSERRQLPPGPKIFLGPKKPESSFRRALVHGPGDQLVINWDGDYRAGVRVASGVTVEGHLQVQASASFAGRVYGIATKNEPEFSVVQTGPEASDHGADLIKLVRALCSKVADLQQRLLQLEKV